jgi:hypothetical protein
MQRAIERECLRQTQCEVRKARRSDANSEAREQQKMS